MGAVRTGRGSRCGRMTLSVVVLNRSLDVRPVCHCSIRQVGCVGAKFTVVVGQLASSTRGPTPLRRQVSSVRGGAADRPVRGGDGYAFVIGAQDAGGGPLPGPDRPRARKHGRMAGRAFGPPLVPIRPAGRLLHGPRWEARSPSSGASAHSSRPHFGGDGAVPYASGATPSRSAPCRVPVLVNSASGTGNRPGGPGSGPSHGWRCVRSLDRSGRRIHRKMRWTAQPTSYARFARASAAV